ncbi:MAG: hypothetical protein PQ975_12420 [Methanobacterium sp.]|jgi:hypothetical protein
MSNSDIVVPEKQKNRFYFTNQEIAKLAAFFALWMVFEVVWLAGPIVGNLVYGIFAGIVLISAARVVGKKYTILTLGIVKTIGELFFAHMYGGTLAALSFLAAAIVLEMILRLSSPYGDNLKINVLGAAISGFAGSLAFVFIIVWIYGMVLPQWIIIARILVPIIPYTIGGFLGYKIGNRVKNVVESV